MKKFAYFQIVCIIALLIVCRKNEIAKQIPEVKPATDTPAIVHDTLAQLSNKAIDSHPKPLTYYDITFSGIGIDSPAKNVLALLGKPDSIGEEIFGGMSGTWVQQWIYPKKGIYLEMHSEKPKGAKSIRTLIVREPCTLQTKQGIKIGDSAQVVLAVYAGNICTASSTPTTIIVGKGIYDEAAIFSIKDGKVDEISMTSASN
jgi:hypothetical protein